MTFIREDLELALNMASEHVKSVAYTSPAVRTVGVLAATATAVPRTVGHLPRIQITGDYGSGKSTYLSALEPLVVGPARISGQLTTRFAVRNIFRDRAVDGTVPVVMVDETKQIFGPTGKRGDTHPLYTIATEGYSKHGAPVEFQEKDQNVRYSCYQVAFLASAGEAALPQDVLDRSIKLRITRKPKGMQLASLDNPEVTADGEQIGVFLQSAVRAGATELRLIARDTDWFEETGLDSRDADKWIVLFAIARLAGGAWPELIKAAYAELGSKDMRNLPAGLQIKVDVLSFVNRGSNPERMDCRALIEYLSELGRACYKYDEAPFTIKRFGMALKAAGVSAFKSNGSVFYFVDHAWLKTALALANPVKTETEDPENDWDVLESFTE